MLTDLQRQKQVYIFNLLDYNKNGYIELEDFIDIAENLCDVRDDELDTEEGKQVMEQCRTLWDKLEQYIDENHDDKCELDEWLKFIEEELIKNTHDWYKDSVNSLVGLLFDIYDTNGDGHIEVDEYLDIFLSFRLQAGQVSKSFQLLDLNGDKEISKQELINAVSEFLLSDDIDAPGNWIFGNWTTNSFAEPV